MQHVSCFISISSNINSLMQQLSLFSWQNVPLYRWASFYHWADRLAAAATSERQRQKQEILHAWTPSTGWTASTWRNSATGNAHGGSGRPASITAMAATPTTSSNSCTTSSNNLTASSSTTSTATQTGYRGNGLSPSPSNRYDTSPPLTVPTPCR